MATFKEKLKDYYGLDEDAFQKRIKAPSFSCLPDISSFSCVNRAIERLKTAKCNKEKVLIYGDYDFDGISATTIIYKALLQYGIRASFYTPSRYLDGYGLTEENVIRITKAGFKLIFTVDNGVSANSAIQKAASLGLETIVLDHHEYEEAPSPIVTLIHPKTVDLSSPNVSAGFLSYLFIRALLKKEDDYLLILGATSLLSDAIPLISYNRDAVNLALCVLNRIKPISFTLLTNKQTFFASTLQMEIIPKINAVGRVETKTETNRVVRYFASEEENELRKLAEYLNQVNEKRKSLTKKAEEEIEIQNDSESLFVITNLPEGLNGLLANRLLNEYEKPVVVFSPSCKDPSVYVGSIRSKEGFDVIKALHGNRAPILSSGGHEFAGGVSVKKENLSLFKKDFEFAALKHHLEKKEKKTISLDKADCTWANYLLLQSFGPFGNENEAPLFSMTIDVDDLTFTKDGKYLSMKIGNEARLFSFQYGIDRFPKEGEATLLCRMEANEWRGNLSLNVLVNEVKGVRD